MNQVKVEVVKQETARVNVDILGISELKWTGMGCHFLLQGINIKQTNKKKNSKHDLDSLQ